MLFQLVMNQTSGRDKSSICFQFKFPLGTCTIINGHGGLSFSYVYRIFTPIAPFIVIKYCYIRIIYTVRKVHHNISTRVPKKISKSSSSSTIFHKTSTLVHQETITNFHSNTSTSYDPESSLTVKHYFCPDN